MNDGSALKPGIDEMLASLEHMAEEMESGELSLEESFAVYEKAVAMLKEVQVRIGEAEQKIMKLSEDGSLVPLDAETDEA